MFLNHPSIFPTVLRSPARPPPPSRAEFLPRRRVRIPPVAVAPGLVVALPRRRRAAFRRRAASRARADAREVVRLTPPPRDDVGEAHGRRHRRGPRGVGRGAVCRTPGPVQPRVQSRRDAVHDDDDEDDEDDETSIAASFVGAAFARSRVPSRLLQRELLSLGRLLQRELLSLGVLQRDPGRLLRASFSALAAFSNASFQPWPPRSWPPSPALSASPSPARLLSLFLADARLASWRLPFPARSARARSLAADEAASFSAAVFARPSPSDRLRRRRARRPSRDASCALGGVQEALDRRLGIALAALLGGVHEALDRRLGSLAAPS